MTRMQPCLVCLQPNASLDCASVPPGEWVLKPLERCLPVHQVHSAALLSGKADGAKGADDAGHDGGRSSGLPKEQVADIVKQLVEALLSGDSSKLGKTSDATGGAGGAGGTNAADGGNAADGASAADGADAGDDSNGLPPEIVELLNKLVEALLQQTAKGQDNAQPNKDGADAVGGPDKAAKSSGTPQTSEQ